MRRRDSRFRPPKLMILFQVPTQLPRNNSASLRASAACNAGRGVRDYTVRATRGGATATPLADSVDRSDPNPDLFGDSRL